MDLETILTQSKDSGSLHMDADVNYETGPSRDGDTADNKGSLDMDIHEI